MNRTMLCAGTACAGALGMFLLDPNEGRRRRHTLRDRSLGMTRRTWRRSLRSERIALQRARGRMKGMLHREPPRTYDDVTLAHKVESVLYRDRDVPKGQLNVDACDGIVTLRGVVDGEATIERIAERTRAVNGVHGVRNLMHVPGTMAPNLDGYRPAVLVRA